jgi:fibronectin type 3 domain-containing protein
MRRSPIFGLMALLLLALAAGCSRYIDSQNPVRSVPEAPPTPINITVGMSSEAVTVSWQVSDSARASRFRIYVSDSTDSNFTLTDSTTAYSKTITGLRVNQLYYFAVATVGQNGVEGLRSTPVSVRVGLLGLTINNGALYTNSLNATLSLVAPLSASYVYLSEDSSFAGSGPLAYSPTRSFTLSQGDGLKTVYARFVFSDGSRSVAPVFGQITLDTRAMIDSIYYSSAATSPYQSGDVVTFYINGGEPGGTASVTIAGAGAPIKLYDDGMNGDETADDGLYSADWIVPVSLNIQNVQVVGSFTDAAGNVAAQTVGAQTITIANAPQPVHLSSAQALTAYSIAIAWSRSAESSFLNYRVFRGATASVDNNATLVKTVVDQASVNFTDTGLVANTMYYYRVYVYNSAGLSAASNVDSARTNIDVPPDPVVLAGIYVSSSTSAQLTWSRSMNSDFSFYQLYRSQNAQVQPSDTSTQRIAVINTSTTDTFTSALPDTTKVYYYQIFVFDQHGQSTGSNIVEIKKP